MIWLAGLKVPVFYWDATIGTPNSSTSPDLSSIQKASDPVMITAQLSMFTLNT